MASSSSATASSSTGAMASGTPMAPSTGTTTEAPLSGQAFAPCLNDPNTTATTNTITASSEIVLYEEIIKVSEFAQSLGEVPPPICQDKIEKGNITTRINLLHYKNTLSYLRPEVREFINEHLPSLKFMLDLSCGGNQTFPGQIVNLVMHAKMNAGKREPEVWFHVNNMPVRIGKKEFCLVSGLSFNNTDEARDKEMNVSWAEKYFPEHKMGNNIRIYVYSQYDIEMAQIKRGALDQKKMSASDLKEEMKKLPSPFKAAAASGNAFAIGAFVPLLAASFIREYHLRLAVVIAAVSVALLVFGRLGAVTGKAPVVKSSMRVLVGGWFAMGITFGSTKLIGLTGL